MHSLVIFTVFVVYISTILNEISKLISRVENYEGLIKNVASELKTFPRGNCVEKMYHVDRLILDDLL